MPAPNTAPSLAQELRHIPLSYDNTDSHESALRICLTLFPEWEHSEGTVEFVRFKDGITNTLLKAIKKRPGYSETQVDNEAILLRAYGNRTEILIDRQRELTAHCLLAQHGLAPPLLARFQNGLVYHYVQGETCSPEDLRKEPIWRAVAQRLAQWHALLPIASTRKAAIIKDNTEVSLGSSPPLTATPGEVVNTITPGKPTPNIWTVMGKWILALPANTSHELEQRKVLQNELKRTVAELGDTPGLGGSGLIFAHCDLLSGNVIIQPRSKSNGVQNGSHYETVNFIDYEYATPSPAAFDLANHFSEWGGFECEYGVLPTRKTRRQFIEEYVASYLRCSSRTLDQVQSCSTRLFQEVDKFRGIPGLYWGIWALIQATISQIDFDYASYAQVRLKEYWDWRAASASGTPECHKESSLREQRWATAE